MIAKSFTVSPITFNGSSAQGTMIGNVQILPEGTKGYLKDFYFEATGNSGGEFVIKESTATATPLIKLNLQRNSDQTNGIYFGGNGRPHNLDLPGRGIKFNGLAFHFERLTILSSFDRSAIQYRPLTVVYDV